MLLTNSFRHFCCVALAALLLLHGGEVWATIYDWNGTTWTNANFPSGYPNDAVIGFADTMTIGGNLSYNTAAAITVTTAQNTGNFGTVTINSGVTMADTASSGTTILYTYGTTGSDTSATTIITNNGVISQGTSLPSSPYGTAISVNNSSTGAMTGLSIQNTGATTGNGIINGSVNYSNAHGTADSITFNNDGAFAAVNGNISCGNYMNVIFGQMSAVNFTLGGNILNAQNVELESGSLTIGGSNSILVNNLFSISSSGVANFNSSTNQSVSNANSNVPTFTSTGAANIAVGFSPTVFNSGSTFGNLYLVTGGSLTSALSNATSLNFGQTNSGSSMPLTSASNSYAISSVTTINVFSGSTLTVANPITGVTNFNVYGTATIASAISALSASTGTFTNDGTTSLNSGGSITMANIVVAGGTFSANVSIPNVNTLFSISSATAVANFGSSGNTSVTVTGNGSATTFDSVGATNIYGTFTPTTFANSSSVFGNLYLAGSGASISGALTSAASLTIGADNTGAVHVGTAYTTNGLLTNVTTITVSNGTGGSYLANAPTFTVANTITGTTTFVVDALATIAVPFQVQDVTVGAQGIITCNSSFTGTGTNSVYTSNAAGITNIASIATITDTSPPLVTFTPTTFGNATSAFGNLYLAGNANISGALTNSASLNIGASVAFASLTATTPTTTPTFTSYTNSGLLSQVAAYNVYGSATTGVVGSTFTVAENITGMTSFTVGAGSVAGAAAGGNAIINALINATGSAVGTYTNNGNTTVGTGGALNIAVLENWGTAVNPATITITGNSGTLALPNSVHILCDGTSCPIVGNISVNGATPSTATMTFGSNSAVAFTTQGTITNVQNIILAANGGTLNVNYAAANGVGISAVQNFTINSGATATFNAQVTGLNGIFSNAGSLNIASTFTPLQFGSLTSNFGDLYLIGSGNISGNLSNPSLEGLLTIGQNSLGTPTACNYTTSGTIANVAAINVDAGTFTVHNPVQNNTGSGVITLTTLAGTTTIVEAAWNSGGGSSTTSTISNNGSLFVTTGGSFVYTTINNYGSVNAGHFNIGTVFDSVVGTSLNNAANSTVHIIGPGGATNLALVGGSALYIGQDSNQQLNAITYNTQNTISSFPSIYVYSGSTFNVDNAVSGVSEIFAVESSATCNVNINGSIVGAGSAANSGTMLVNSTFSMTSITNNYGGSLTFAPALSGPTVITNNTPIVNESGANLYFQGTTTDYVNNGGVSINNSGYIQFSSASTPSGTAGNFQNTGAITNLSGGTIEFYNNVYYPSGTGAITNQSGGTLNVTAAAGTTATNNSPISNYGAMNFIGALAGTGIITNETNSPAAVLTFGSGTVNSNPITNNANATFNVTSNSTNNAPLTNYGNMTVSAQLNGVSGSYSITNEAGGTLALQNGTNTNHPTSNYGTLTTSGTVTVDNIITNYNAMTVTGTLNANNNLTNASSLTLAGNLNLGGNSLSSNANTSVTVSGQQMLTAANYTNNGTHYTTITSAGAYDQLQCPGCVVNLSSAVLNINFSVNNTNGVPISWVILTGSNITMPAISSNIIIPASNIYAVYNVQNTGTQVIVTANIAQPYSNINTKIAGVINALVTQPANPGQQAIANAFLSINKNLNDDLHQMIPVVNALRVGLTTQNSLFNKVEARIAAVRDNYKVASIQQRGINAGDVMGHRNTWISTSGSITNQRPSQDNDGYNALSGLILVGHDFEAADNVMGFGFGYSRTHLKEFSNESFNSYTRRYHGLAYGTYSFNCGDYVDWLFTGEFDTNNTVRIINVASTNYNSKGHFTGYQFAGRLVRGKAFDLWDTYRLTPLTSIQVSHAMHHSYSETGSVMAMHVNENVQNLVTLGLGTKFAFPISDWDSIGMRELRAILTYDVLHPKNTTTANFVVGSASFDVVDVPQRLALKLGASMTFELAKKLLLDVNYDFELRNKFTDHTGLLKVRYVF